MVRYAILALFLTALAAPMVSAQSSNDDAATSPWACDSNYWTFVWQFPADNPDWIDMCLANTAVGPYICGPVNCEGVDATVESLAPPVHNAMCLTNACPFISTYYHYASGIVFDELGQVLDLSGCLLGPHPHYCLGST